MKKYLFLLILLLYTHFLFAQAPSVIWDKTLGGDGLDRTSAIALAPDGNLIVAGWSGSVASGDKSQNSRGGDDYWVIKINQNGFKIWDLTIGSCQDIDELTSMVITSDGNIVVAGNTNSNACGEKSENNIGGKDFWVVKINQNGVIVWDKTTGGLNTDKVSSMIATSDGGIVCLGTSSSNSSVNKSENSRGGDDYWIIKLNSNGNPVWDRTFGGSGSDLAAQIVKTNDGGFLIGGSSNSPTSGDKSSNSSNGDYWIIKLNSNGEIQWDKTFGSIEDDYLKSMLQLSDGTFLLSGESYGNQSGYKSENSKGGIDYWIIKIDSNGNKVWDRTLGGNLNDLPRSVVQSPDGNIIIVGNSSSNQSTDKSENSKGGIDYWVVKLNLNGQKIWDKTIGGNLNDEATSILNFNNESLIISGSSGSNNSGDKSENNQEIDYWVVKLGYNCTSTSIINTLKSTPINSNSLEASWLQNLSNVNYFQYKYKRVDESTWSAISNTSNSFSIQGLSQGQTYHYQIRAVCANGQQTAWFDSPTATLPVKLPQITTNLAARGFKIEQGSADIVATVSNSVLNNRLRILVAGTNGYKQDYLITANASGGGTINIPTALMTEGFYGIRVQDEGPISSPYSKPLINNNRVEYTVTEPPASSRISITNFSFVEGINKFRVNWSDYIQKGSPYPQENSATTERTVRYKIELGEKSVSGVDWFATDTYTGSAKVLQNANFSFLLDHPSFHTLIPIDGTFVVRITDLDKLSSTKTSAEYTYTPYSNLTVDRVWDFSYSGGGTVGLINGAAADGTARFYLKINAINTAITKVRVELYDENDSQAAGNSVLGKLKLATVLNTFSNEANDANAINIESTNKINGSFWIWYVAPDDFYKTGFDYASERTVKLKIIGYDNGNNIVSTNISDIQIVRPPLLLVHGLGGGGGFDDGGTWRKFGYNITPSEANLFADKKLHKVVRSPQMSGDGSFEVNARLLLGLDLLTNNYVIEGGGELQKSILELRNNGIAVNRNDYVAHSMGGNMLRMAIDKPLHFYSNYNYGKGYVNKFITLTTPHNGSPLGDIVKDVAPYSGIVEGIKDVLASELTTFFKFDSNNNIIGASDAVSNLAVQPANNGIKFNTVDGNKTKSHVIVSDFVNQENNYNAIDAFSSIALFATSLDKISDRRFAFNLMADIVFKGAVKKNANNPNILNELKKIRCRTFLCDNPDNFLNEQLQTSEETVNFINYYSGVVAGSSYTNYLNESDLIVPFSSQLSKLSVTASNVTHNKISIGNNYLNFHANHNFFPDKITGKVEIGNRVLELLNTPISSILFGGLPATNTTPYNAIIEKIPSSLNSTTNTLVIKNVRDLNKAKIINPQTNNGFLLGSTIDVTTNVVDTTYQIYSNIYFLDNIVPLPKTNSNLKSFATSNKKIGKQILYFESMYKFGNDSLITYWDTVSVNISSNVGLVSIEGITKTKTIFKNDTTNISLKLLYPEYIAYLESSQSGISVVSANPSIVGINSLNNDIIGKEVGTTTITLTYNGLSTNVIIEVLPNTTCMPPAAPILPQVGSFTYQQFTLTASGCSGTVKWFLNSTDTNPFFTGNPLVTPILFSGKTYFASCTVGGCESSRVSTAIGVYPCQTSVVHGTGYLAPNVFSQGQTIVSQKDITQRGFYRASNSITLNPGFQVGSNELFIAEIGTCATMPENGLVAYYPFNNGSMNDESGNSNHATNNEATLIADRRNATYSAYYFNGTNAWLNTPMVQYSGGGYTVSAWVKPEFTANQEYVILQNRGTTPGSGRSFTLHYQYSTGRWGFALDGDGIYIGKQAPSPNTTNWIHVVGVWSGGTSAFFNSNQFKVYVNGVLLSANSIDIGGANRDSIGSGTVAIGLHQAWNSYFRGAMDDIRIYNRALTDAEVQSIYTIER